MNQDDFFPGVPHPGPVKPVGPGATTTTTPMVDTGTLAGRAAGQLGDKGETGSGPDAKTPEQLAAKRRDDFLNKYRTLILLPLKDNLLEGAVNARTGLRYTPSEQGVFKTMHGGLSDLDRMAFFADQYESFWQYVQSVQAGGLTPEMAPGVFALLDPSNYIGATREDLLDKTFPQYANTTMFDQMSVISYGNFYTMATQVKRAKFTSDSLKALMQLANTNHEAGKAVWDAYAPDGDIRGMADAWFDQAESSYGELNADDLRKIAFDNIKNPILDQQALDGALRKLSAMIAKATTAGNTEVVAALTPYQDVKVLQSLLNKAWEAAAGANVEATAKSLQDYIETEFTNMQAAAEPLDVKRKAAEVAHNKFFAAAQATLTSKENQGIRHLFGEERLEALLQEANGDAEDAAKLLTRDINLAKEGIAATGAEAKVAAAEAAWIKRFQEAVKDIQLPPGVSLDAMSIFNEAAAMGVTPDSLLAKRLKEAGVTVAGITAAAEAVAPIATAEGAAERQAAIQQAHDQGPDFDLGEAVQIAADNPGWTVAAVIAEARKRGTGRQEWAAFWEQSQRAIDEALADKNVSPQRQAALQKLKAGGEARFRQIFDTAKMNNKTPTAALNEVLAEIGKQVAPADRRFAIQTAINNQFNSSKDFDPNEALREAEGNPNITTAEAVAAGIKKARATRADLVATTGEKNVTGLFGLQQALPAVDEGSYPTQYTVGSQFSAGAQARLKAMLAPDVTEPTRVKPYTLQDVQVAMTGLAPEPGRAPLTESELRTYLGDVGGADWALQAGTPSQDPAALQRIVARRVQHEGVVAQSQALAASKAQGEAAQEAIRFMAPARAKQAELQEKARNPKPKKAVVRRLT